MYLTIQLMHLSVQQGSPHISHVKVSLSKTLNPQLLPDRFTAAHCSLITKDGSNAEKKFPTVGLIIVYIIIIVLH